MKKPYIFCHMMTSLDGKIMGNYMNTPNGKTSDEVFYNLAFGAKPHYHHQGWESDEMCYIDTTAHIIEVLSGNASNAYKAFLRKLGISYVIVGENTLDYNLLCEKLYALFGIKTLMIGGGGVLNWSFLQAGLCDEVSVVIAATADGSCDTPTLFTTKEGLSCDKAISFKLKNVDVLKGDSVWLRYTIQNEGEINE